MTLIKSLLLGSAAGLVAVASAQAADLPTRKGPVAAEYVRVCSITVAGTPVVGFVLPGSDTCSKLSGYVTAQIEAGNLRQGYGYSPLTGAQAIGPNRFNSDSYGWTTRYNQSLDAVSNTAFGPLVAHAEFQFNHGNGFDSTGTGGSDGGLNRAYVTWAGITAGKADSFFSFTGGGYGYANFFSPDRKGYNQPDLLAYTASFGGGFAATISIESSAADVLLNYDGAAGSTNVNYDSGSETGYPGSASQAGHRWPDIVGALSVHQAWGSAQISGVAHDVRASSLINNTTLDKWGYAVDAGVQFNIPQIAGSLIGVTGVYSQNASWYSGIPDGMWGENGEVNGNGQGMLIGDAFSETGGGWATPTAWSVTAYSQFTLNPQWTLQLEGSYGENHWSGDADGVLFNSKSFIVGGLIHYDPVKNLDFALEVLYQDTTNSTPAAFIAGGPGFTNTFHNESDGFAGRFMVTRSF